MREIKLKGIVQKMIDAGESEELIKEVITKYRARNADFADDLEPEIKKATPQTDATVDVEDTASDSLDTSLESPETVVEEPKIETGIDREAKYTLDDLVDLKDDQFK